MSKPPIVKTSFTFFKDNRIDGEYTIYPDELVEKYKLYLHTLDSEIIYGINHFRIVSEWLMSLGSFDNEIFDEMYELLLPVFSAVRYDLRGYNNG
tara:strand:- start:628 stop:912 length:285 start_codon:yes stop_codon:yes gene_type:complete